MSRERVDEIIIQHGIRKCIESIEKEIPDIQVKIDEFLLEFNKEFPLEENPEDRGRAIGCTWPYFDIPIVLYAIGMKGAAVIDLHGILERLVLMVVVENIAQESKLENVTKLAERRTLPDLAQILVDLEIIDTKDKTFIEKLNKLRNGLAHKNPKKISNALCSGKEISFTEIDSKAKDIDFFPLLIGSIKILVKMTKSMEK